MMDRGSVSFNDIPKNYLPEKDLEVAYSLLSPASRDWVGLFRVGWSSSRDYYTFAWAPVPTDTKGSVTFAGRRLPPQDKHFYQFCYVASDGTVKGASSSFQFRVGVSFNGVLKNYPPGKKIEIHYSLNDGFSPASRDWVGLFRMGWSSSKGYYTFEWTPTPNDKKGSVVFPGRRLPPQDGHFYQFCYVDRNGAIKGVSSPFQFSKFPMKGSEESLTRQPPQEVLKSLTRQPPQKVFKTQHL